MTRDRKTDMQFEDSRLSALYEAHVGDGDRPSAASDARIRALARAAVETKAAAQVTKVSASPAREASARSGWRSWLEASWFKPSLAFATLASLSVIIVALMPREEISIERAETSAQPAAAKSSVAAKLDATVPQKKEAAAAVQEPAPARERSTEADNARPSKSESAVEKRAATEPEQARKQKAASAASATPSPKVLVERERQSLPARQASADAARQAHPSAADVPAPIGQSAAGAAPASPAAGSVLSERRAANPFPAQPSTQAPAQENYADRTKRSDFATRVPAPAAPAVTPATAPSPASSPPPAANGELTAKRIEKPSNLSEPSDARGNARPLPEVRDSAPTYPNEARSSIPMPYSYSTARPRPPGSDAKLAAPSAGSLAGMARQAPAQPPAAMQRKDESPALRSMESGPSLATAAPRDPAEWIKAILKLRTEGKTEQVVKELAEFRKQFPAYQLPEELKRFAVPGTN